ncbi:hypothetical protein R3I93_014229 [Phoxinus phoxinus]|uniref:Vitelline membrane outer layer protein 1 homolog n=1 Tax=Phoxinus phoxinus TaxID=58324 RepID=A0AAN9CNS4_9TELE
MHHFFSMMFSLLAIIGPVSVTSAESRSERSVDRPSRSQLTVTNGMLWGTWRGRHMCPAGTYAAGFSVKVERPGGDDTALNGISIYCVDRSRIVQSTQSSGIGNWGQWTSMVQWCPSGYLTSFQLRVESCQRDGDDTAANNIRFKCTGGDVIEELGTGWGNWGDYGEWSPKCEGTGICGIQTRIEEPQGVFDDTALNDVRMFCCD